MAGVDEILEHHPSRYVQPSNDGHRVQGSANTDCDLTFDGVENMRQVVWNVFWSYSAEPTAGTIQFFSGGNAITPAFSIVSGGVGWLRAKFVGIRNQNLMIRLGAAGAGVTGNIWVEQHWVRP